MCIRDSVNGDAVAGAAVFRVDDDILGHVPEFAGHVAGVCRFQGGIRQTLASAVDVYKRQAFRWSGSGSWRSRRFCDPTGG